MHNYLKLFWLLLLSCSQTANAQLLPYGNILEDTITTGQTIRYALSYQHSQEQEVFFPDSTFDFSPYTFLKKEVFTTHTNDHGSLDSAIYFLMSYEIKPKITFQLPIFLWNGKDCTAIYPIPDTALVQLMVNRNALDTLEVSPIVDIVPVKSQINYSVVVVLSLLVGLILSGIYALFGEQIKKQWRVFQLRRRYSDFNRNFNRHFQNAKNKGSVPDVEIALILWKKYLERLEKMPFTTFTTREISDNIPDVGLRFALRDIDEIIYGTTKAKDIGNSLQVLNNIAQRHYLRKRREIINKQP